jgi:hypothetical protein
MLIFKSKYMKYLFYPLLILLFLQVGCKKQDDWLNAKSNISDITPSSLTDYQNIMDNEFFPGSYSTIGLMGTDNFYVKDANLGSIETYERNAYLWNSDIWENTGDDGEYQQIYLLIGYTNIVLDGLNKVSINTSEQNSYNNVKGQALFYRSFLFYNLLNLFSLPYDKQTSSTDLGIAIRLTSDVNTVVQRSTVLQALQQIINDLKIASPLLPIIPENTSRASRTSALALLSKVYLYMQDYTNAKSYADTTLNYNDNLLNFNSSAISLAQRYRFPTFQTGNPEIILYGSGSGGQMVTPNPGGLGFVDSVLYRSYDSNDLRKTFLFAITPSGEAKFRGTYTGINQNYCGISTNEMYLIRAECNARLNNVDLALADVNQLLQNRYVTGTYTNYNTSIADSALYFVLREKRKELPFNSLSRWEDLRRLNKDPRFAKTLYRFYNGSLDSLPPNSPKYAYPLPVKEIQLGGLIQNKR